jgi:DNA-3-methyladenine glycosylase II
MPTGSAPGHPGAFARGSCSRVPPIGGTMPSMTNDFTIEPQGPFSLAAARDFAGGFAAGIGGGATTGTSLILAFPVEGWRDSAVVELRQDEDGGPVSGRILGTKDATTAQRQAARSVSLDHDGSGWPEVGQRDPVIGGLQATYRSLRPVCFYSAYEAVTSFVIGQRIARRQAARIKESLGERFGDELELDGATYHAFPRPERLLEAREINGLPPEKVRRLHGLAEAAIEGRLDTERLRSLPKDEALAELQTLHGVGTFTAEGTLLRGCGVVDELPSDPMTAEAIGDFYGLPSPLDAASWNRITEGWRPYRMWATVLLRVGMERAKPGQTYRR